MKITGKVSSAYHLLRFLQHNPFRLISATTDVTDRKQIVLYYCSKLHLVAASSLPLAKHFLILEKPVSSRQSLDSKLPKLPFRRICQRYLRQFYPDKETLKPSQLRPFIFWESRVYVHHLLTPITLVQRTTQSGFGIQTLMRKQKSCHQQKFTTWGCSTLTTPSS